MTTEELIKKVEELESKVERQAKQIEALSRNMVNVPSRIEVDSVARQQQGGSIFDVLF